MIAPLALALAVLASDGPPEARRPPPATGAASFSGLPEMWGLRELSGAEQLGDLDASFVLYLPQRARAHGTAGGWVYFAGGRQLVVEAELTEPDVADLLRSYACVCGLEYETAAPSEYLQTAAGAYRVQGPPVVESDASGIVRVEFRFEPMGQAAGTRLRRFVCWSDADGTLEPIAGALPWFAKLTRKDHPGFVDPPVDDRPVRDHETSRQAPVIALGDEYLGRAYDAGRPLRLDAPELIGTAKPGLFTLLREIRTGRKLTIDYSDYYENLDPFLRDLNRRSGICYRDPCYWP